MRPPAQGAHATAALGRRLGVLQDLWCTTGPRASAEGDRLFDAIVDLVASLDHAPHRVWLLIAGLTGAMPDQSLVRAATRNLGFLEVEQAVVWMLGSVAPLARERGCVAADIRLVTDHPVLDVTSVLEVTGAAAGASLFSEVAAHWCLERELELATWTSGGGALRTVNDQERAWLMDPVAEWIRPRGVRDRAPLAVTEIVVPWGVPVVVMGPASPSASERMVALTEVVSSTVRLIGRDCAPVASAETMPHGESDDFCNYLELVKHAEVVVGASSTAAAEFAGFAGALTAQGLGGPRVLTCPLPTSLPLRGTLSEPPSGPGAGRPVVICVDHPGPRATGTALVEAAELLWRQGFDFDVRLMVSPTTRPSAAENFADDLQRRGRSLGIDRDPSQTHLATALAQARCLVYLPLHDGYGLPVIEALTAGVPVITSDFGSVREAAEDRGGRLVDPADVIALTAHLRALLSDDELHAALVEQTGQRPIRTVEDYADELWDALVT